MHEMSLMAEILSIVSDDARFRGFTSVDKIEIIVGDFSNVLADALELAFLHFCSVNESLLTEKSVLHILREAAVAECQSCSMEFTPDYRIALCPACEQVNCHLISGETFRVEYYEGSGSNED